MTRLERKDRKDILSSVKPGPNSPLVLIDDYIKSIWRINDEEYDYIVEILSDEELSLFCLYEKPSISELKRIINIVNQHVYDFQNKTLLIRDQKIENLI